MSQPLFKLQIIIHFVLNTTPLVRLELETSTGVPRLSAGSVIECNTSKTFSGGKGQSFESCI